MNLSIVSKDIPFHVALIIIPHSLQWLVLVSNSYGMLRLPIHSSESSNYHPINSFGMNGLFQWR